MEKLVRQLASSPAAWRVSETSLHTWRGRLLSFVTSLWVIITVSFAALYLLPGDPARLILGPQASAESIAAFRRDQELDQPFASQYGHYLGRIARLDLGLSFTYRRPVRALLWERAIVTGHLALLAAVVVIVMGIAVPVSVRLFRLAILSRVIEQLLGFLALTPPYVLAAAALLGLAGQLRWLPAIFDPANTIAWWVPASVLSAYPTAIVHKVFSERLSEELATAYVLRARALGHSYSHIILREVLPNALAAPVAALANGISYFVTGAFFVEAVFGVPGLGRLTQEALRNKDVAVLGGLCLLFGALIVTLSHGLDILQERLSPRSFQSNRHA